MDQIAHAIHESLRQIYAREVFIITGKHIQRDPTSGVFRFLPGRSKQSLLNDVGTFTEHFVTCCRGVGFNLRVTETDKGGVSLNIMTSVNKEAGERLVERGGG